MLKIHELIRASGYTLKEIADAVGDTEENLTRSISGNPTMDKLEMIAHILGVKVTDFLCENQEEDELYGVVIFKKKTYKIGNRQDLDKLYDDVHKGYYQVKSFFYTGLERGKLNILVISISLTQQLPL